MTLVIKNDGYAFLIRLDLMSSHSYNFKILKFLSLSFKVIDKGNSKFDLKLKKRYILNLMFQLSFCQLKIMQNCLHFD